MREPVQLETVLLVDGLGYGEGTKLSDSLADLRLLVMTRSNG
jgi:hypothetical protein